MQLQYGKPTGMELKSDYKQKSTDTFNTFQLIFVFHNIFIKSLKAVGIEYC